jgi:hypothetical protein
MSHLLYNQNDDKFGADQEVYNKYAKSWEQPIRDTNIKLGFISDGDASRYYLKQNREITSINDEAGHEFFKLIDHHTDTVKGRNTQAIRNDTK